MDLPIQGNPLPSPTPILQEDISMENNRKLFPRLKEKMRSQNFSVFETHAKKFSSWLSDHKAYYTEARPHIIDILQSAHDNLCTILGQPNIPITWEDRNPEHEQWQALYIQMLKAVAQFAYMFHETHLHQQLMELLLNVRIQPVLIPPSKPPSRSLSLRTDPGTSHMFSESHQPQNSFTFPPVPRESRYINPTPGDFGRTAGPPITQPYSQPPTPSSPNFPNKMPYHPPKVIGHNSPTTLPVDLVQVSNPISVQSTAPAVLREPEPALKKKKKKKFPTLDFIQADLDWFKTQKGAAGTSPSAEQSTHVEEESPFSNTAEGASVQHAVVSADVTTEVEEEAVHMLAEQVQQTEKYNDVQEAQQISSSVQNEPPLFEPTEQLSKDLPAPSQHSAGDVPEVIIETPSVPLVEDTDDATKLVALQVSPEPVAEKPSNEAAEVQSEPLLDPAQESVESSDAKSVHKAIEDPQSADSRLESKTLHPQSVELMQYTPIEEKVAAHNQPDPSPASAVDSDADTSAIADKPSVEVTTVMPREDSPEQPDDSVIETKNDKIPSTKQPEDTHESPNIVALGDNQDISVSDRLRADSTVGESLAESTLPPPANATGPGRITSSSTEDLNLDYAYPPETPISLLSKRKASDIDPSTSSFPMSTNPNKSLFVFINPADSVKRRRGRPTRSNDGNKQYNVNPSFAFSSSNTEGIPQTSPFLTRYAPSITRKSASVEDSSEISMDHDDSVPGPNRSFSTFGADLLSPRLVDDDPQPMSSQPLTTEREKPARRELNELPAWTSIDPEDSVASSEKDELIEDVETPVEIQPQAIDEVIVDPPAAPPDLARGPRPTEHVLLPPQSAPPLYFSAKDCKTLLVARGSANPEIETHSFYVNTNQISRIAIWRNRTNLLDELMDSLCLSLACFHFDDVAPLIGDSDSELVPFDQLLNKSEIECRWPSTQNAWIVINEKWENGILLPPFFKTQDKFVDVSALVQSGPNTVEIHHQSAIINMSDYVFAMFLHSPSSAYFVRIAETAQKEVRWTNVLRSMEEDVRYPKFDWTKGTMAI